MTQASHSAPQASHPVFRHRARDLMRAGKAAVVAGQIDEGIALLRAAFALDPSVVCLPWGLMPHLAAQGRDGFRARMQQRLKSWYRAPQSQVHAQAASLTRKPVMHGYVGQLGLPLPRQMTQAARIEELDWANLPEQVVIKPENGASSDGVIVAQGGIDHIAQAPIKPDLKTYACALYDRSFDKPQPVFAEQMLRDVAADQDPAVIIPRDFKVFAAGGHVGLVRVHDRNAPDGRRSLACYDRSGRRVPASLKGWPVLQGAPDDDMMPADTTAQTPAGWDALIAMAEYLSQKQPWLLRLDFYLTPQGPVFGEFTTYPNAGLNLTPFARRTLLQLWECWPDA